MFKGKSEPKRRATDGPHSGAGPLLFLLIAALLLAMSQATGVSLAGLGVEPVLPLTPSELSELQGAPRSQPVEVLTGDNNYFLKVDLHAPQVRFRVALANNDSGGLESLAGMKSRYEGQGYEQWAIVNGDLFSAGCPGGVNCAQGLTYIDGVHKPNWSEYGSTWMIRGNLGLDASKSVQISVGDAQSKRHMTIGGGPRILMGGGTPTCQAEYDTPSSIAVCGPGKTLFPTSGECFDGDVRYWCSDTRAITMLGYSADGQYLYTGISLGGKTVTQLAQWLKDRGAHEILRMDSGSSSGMYDNGTFIGGTSSKPIANAFALIVDSAPPPPPTPTPVSDGCVIEVCDDTYYGGDCWVFTVGRYPDLRDYGCYDRIESIRFKGDCTEGCYHAVLSTEIDFGGHPCHFDEDDDCPEIEDACRNRVRSIEFYCRIPGSPSLQSPDDGAIFDEGHTVTLCWSDTGDEYYGEVWGGPGGTVPFGWQSGTCKDIDAPTAGYTYQWHVKARSQCGESDWSSTWSFTVREGPTTTPTRTPTKTPTPTCTSAPLADKIYLPFIVKAYTPPIYVDGSNTGSEDGSRNYPWNTISEALDSASNDDAILVAQGVYIENITVDKEVTLKGGYESAGWTRNITEHETIIDGSNSRTVVGDWDGNQIHMSIVISDSGEFKMWYNGRNICGQDGIGLATSPDGIAWTKYTGNPVFTATVDWEEDSVGHPHVIKDVTWYKMWYGPNDEKIGYAWSSDGLSWTKDANNPILEGTEGEWDENGVGAPFVIKMGSNDYRMWYHNRDLTGIGYATSADSINWTKYAGNPVLSPGVVGAWDSEQVADPNVLFDGTTYHMWYAGNSGNGWQIGYAWSADGITWNKSVSNPLLSPGASGAWDEYSVSEPNVLFDGALYRMWFSGCQDGWHMQRGYATSLDGITWGKYPGNPVLTRGTPGQWGQPVVKFVEGSDGSVLDGFTVRNGEAEHGSGVLVDGAEAMIRNCTVVSNTAQYDGGGIGLIDTHATVAASVILSNTVRGDGGGGGGILVDSAIVTLTNNVIAFNKGLGMAWDGDGVAVWGDYSDARIINNTIVSNSAEGIQANQGTVLARNNIIYDNEGGIHSYLGGATVSSDHNAFWDNGWDYAGVTPGPGDISADPLFVNAAAEDFHLQPGSPCIDAGTNVGAPDHDFEGDPRPDGGFVDIGADEYQGMLWLWFENFEDGVADGWTTYFSTWEVVEDESSNYIWRGTGPDDYPQAWLTKDWTDFAFQTRVRIRNGGVLICTRAQGGSSFYNAYLPDGGTVSLAKYSDGDYTVYLTTDYQIYRDTWYLTRVEVEGAEYRLYIDGELVATHVDYDSPLLQGGIGFYMGGGDTIEFDDIRVWLFQSE